MSGASGERRPVGAGEVTGAFIFAYIIAIALLAALVLWGGLWQWLANTRILAWLIDAGVIALTDQDIGFIAGVPEAQFYIIATSPVDWGLVLAAAGLFILFWLIKAVQFHGIAQFLGSPGSTWQHARAYLYGDGLGRVLPYAFGSAAIMTTMEAQGDNRNRAGLSVFISELFTIFEIMVFATVALYLIGWSNWINALLWTLMILAACYFFVRMGSSRGMFTTVRGGGWGAAWQMIRGLSQQPGVLIYLAALSIGAFLMLDVAAYIIMAAFTSEEMILHIDSSLLIMAIVGSHIAMFIKITPGGIGQREWGFAATLFAAGVAPPEAMTAAILYGTIKYLSGLVLLIGVRFFFGAEASLQRTMDLFRGMQPAEQAAA